MASTRALSLAAQGQHEDALRLAETAVDMVPAEMVNLVPTFKSILRRH